MTSDREIQPAPFTFSRSSNSERTAPTAGRAASVAGAVTAVLLIWGFTRAVFFEGFAGSDDLAHISYAQNFDRIPTNHWETRIFYNSLLHLSISRFGTSRITCTIPSLFGSLLLLGATMFYGFRALGIRGLLASGVLAATLPIDVIFSTLAHAGTLAVGFASVGTAVYLAARGVRRVLGASVLLALGVLAHPMLVFYIFALGGAFILLGRDRRERLAALACVATSTALYFVAEMTIFALLTGDPSYEFKLLEKLERGVMDPNFEMFSRGWFLYPLTTFIFCKDFGITILVATVGAILLRKRLPQDHICLALLCLLFWFWIGYGTRKPTAYQPFWRATRFDYPLVMSTCIVVGSCVCSLRRWGLALVGLLVAMNLGLLASSGPWAQGIKISEEFLDFVRNHPTMHFITDHKTQREITVLNGGSAPANLEELPAESDAIPDLVGSIFLWNPVYEKNLPDGLKLGEVQFETRPRLRMLASFMPDSLIRWNRDWWTRRPAGQAIAIEPDRALPTSRQATQPNSRSSNGE